MKVAISAEDDLFKLNRILDEDWAMKYPGASWIPLLKKYLESDIELVTADVALDHVQKGFWISGEIYVIQHGCDNIAYQLIEKGAIPLVLVCFESPLYIGSFYKNVSTIAPYFKNRILFSGLHKMYQAEAGNEYHVTFPSYFLDNKAKHFPPWNERKFMVVVMGNKYLVPSCCPALNKPVEWYWWLRKKVAQYIYQSSPSDVFFVKKLQLQDARLKLISFFMAHGLLDLYGKGWGSLRNLPPHWHRILSPLLKNNPPRLSENKLKTIKEYKYCMCVENAMFPGYVTEKIIDCLVAGVIPLYMGAPDIEEFIPKSCFIDLRDYRNLDALLSYLHNISKYEANQIIACGQEFLRGKKGESYSYECFAKFTANIIRTEYMSTR